MSEAARKLRIRMANNGRNPANGNMGIRVGSDLHLAEMLLKEREDMLSAIKGLLRVCPAERAGMKLAEYCVAREIIAKAEST